MMIGLGHISALQSVIDWILSVLLLSGLISLVIWFVTRLTKIGDNSKDQTPVEIIRERYAKGEITKEQFEQIYKALK
jgi:putative membrane protein